MQENYTDTLPAEVHKRNLPSTRVRKPKLYIQLDGLFPPIPPRVRRRTLALGLAAVAVIGVALLWRWGGGGHSSPSGTDGGLHGGIPSVIPPATDREPEDTTRSEPAVSQGEETLSDTLPPEESAGSHPLPETDLSDRPAESAPLPDEPPTDPADETDPASPPADDGTTDTPPMPDTDPPDDPETTAPPEPLPPPIPDGCVPIHSLDMSEADRGAGYIHNAGVVLPTTLPTDSPWRTASPAVLIVNTHPYEGYSDGEAWYDPASGGLALTDSPNDPDGVVALGSTLARALRDMGVTVIHLRVAVAAGESSSEIYDRTESMIRHYCRLYPDIGLVIDLRRSAELTADGEILRTEGSRNGEPCAQLRVSVSGGRDSAALGRDLAVALSIRESLWEAGPSLSRPVRVKSGQGLVPDLTDIRVLTLEAGSAGNTCEEARRLVPPLSESLAKILQNFG